MGVAESSRDTRDNISARDTNKDEEIRRNKEIIYGEENTTIGKTNTIGHSFILGHSVNGVLGVANGVDGQQVILGEAGRDLTIVRVINPNKTFKEHFRDTTFDDGGDMNWDTTNHRLSLE